ncbi:MAG: restriction endonuclease, partial [Hyphomicrobiaceae bacterium]|nr:restriction endonuclease [Hyphomicrobiaceae bacterium]
MSTIHIVPDDIRELYEVHEWRNAAGVLSTARPSEWTDIIATLRGFRLYKADVVRPGGSKSNIAARIDGTLLGRGWKETKFDTAIKIDEVETPSPTHWVDCFKNRVALEVEWNNKDPFYDRDLNNFRLLFDLRVIDAGVI